MGRTGALHSTRRQASDPSAAASAAGLRYVTDEAPGILRRRSGRGFLYVDPGGKRLRDPADLDRIRRLAIPPAWIDVWICRHPLGHIQATGRDARGRKQYRYHPRWRSLRDETKYARLAAFGQLLPTIRRRVDRDLARPGLPREKVLAAVLRLLDATLIRVGNPEYARDNGSFGLTTMRGQHVNVFGSTLRFRFRGKGGKLHVADLPDRRLAQVVKRCQELPGQELFQYVDDQGEARSVDSVDVNEYLRQITRQDFTAKDFRTWGGSVLAARALLQLGDFDDDSDGRKKVLEAVRQVAEQLGNTPAVCRDCYIHPDVVEAYLDRSLHRMASMVSGDGPRGLRRDEAVVLATLRRRGRARSTRPRLDNAGGNE